MAYTLSMRLKGEGNSTTRRVQVAGTTIAQAETNALGVITWYDGITSMRIINATLSGKIETTAVLPTTAAAATSRINRVLRVGVRYDATALNKASIEIPSVSANQVEDGVATPAAEAAIAGLLIPATLSVHGDAAQLITYTKLDYTKRRRNRN